MARYRITFVDTVTRIFYVNADSREEAEELTDNDAIDGDIHEVWEGVASTAEEVPTNAENTAPAETA